MADYDLGTARGRIVIDEDTRGSDQAARSMAQLALAAKALERTFRSTEAAMNNMERNLQMVSQQSIQTSRSAGNLQGSFSRLGSSVRNVTGEILGMNTATTVLESSLAAAAQAGIKLNQSISSITNLPGLIGRVSGSFIGLGRTMDEMPSWTRSLSNITTGIVAVGAVATRVLPRIGLGFRTAAYTAALMSPALAGLLAHFRPLNGTVGALTARFGAFGAGIIQSARGIGQMVLGVGLLRNAFASIGVAAKAATLTLAGLSAVAGGIKVVGTVALGAANAVKQLSGALLLVPGAVAGAGIAFGVAKLAVTGLEEAFKASTKTGAEFDEAVKNLSPEMKKIARAAKEVTPEFKKLREVAESTVLAGFSEDIRVLGKTYLPALHDGVGRVGTGLNQVKNGFKDFLTQPATVQDLNGAFGDTSEILHNVARGVWPISAALRDVAAVGLEVFASLSGGIGLSSRQFGNFISEARRSGDLRQWILDALQGFKDLGASIVAIGSIFKTVFQAFGADGDNALTKLRIGTERLRDSLKQSADSGGLRTVAESLERMSDISLAVIQTAMDQLFQVMKRIAPFAERMSEAFGGTLLAAFKAIGAAAQVVASALSHMSGLGSVVGVVLALGIAFKTLTLVMLPVVRAATAVVGALSLMRGAANAVGGLNASMHAAGVGARVAGVQMGALGSAIAGIGTRVPVIARMQESFVRGATAASHFGRTMGTVRAAMTGMAAAGSSLMSLIGGPWVAAILLAVGALVSIKSSFSAVSKANAQMATNAKNAEAGIDDLVEAFVKADGVVNKGVFETLSNNIKTMRGDLEATADTATGFWADMGAGLRDIGTDLANFFTGKWGEGFTNSIADQNDKIDQMAAKAKNAAKAIDDLNMSNAEISKAISGSQGDWDAIVGKLQAMGEWGRDAIASLAPMRQRFVEIKDSMARIGPESINLSEAFQTLSDASASAADRLGAIRSALQALGILETSATEAAFNLTETIKQVGEAAASALGPADQLGQALLNGQGGFNTTNASAKILHDRLKDLGDALLETAATGGNVDEAYGQMQGSLDALAQSSNLSRNEIDQLARTVGVAPKELNILVSLKGNTEAQAEIKAVLAEASRASGQTFEITAIAKTQAARDAIQQLGFQIQLVNAETGEVKVTGNTADAQTKLTSVLTAIQQLSAQKPQVNIGTNAPAVAGQIGSLYPAITGIPQPAPINVTAPGAPAVQGTLAQILQSTVAIPGAVQVPTAAPGAPAVQQQIGGIQQSAAALPPGITMPIQAPGAQQTQDTLGIILGMTKTPPAPINIPVSAPGAPEAQGQINDVNNAVNNLKPPPPLQLTLNGVPEAVGGLQQFDGAISNSLSNFNRFVEGIRAAMTTAVGAVQQMARDVNGALAQAASTANSSGQALGQGFADGINSKVDEVRAAALALAEAAAAPLPRSPAKIGPFAGQGWTPFRGRALAVGFAKGIAEGSGDAINASIDMAKAIASAMDGIRVAANIPATAFGANRAPGPSGSRFFRDPTISDQELAEKRAEKDRLAAERATEDARFKESDERKKKAEESEEVATKSAQVTGRSAKDIEALAKKFDLQITSNKRNEPGSFHHTGEAFDISGSAANMARLNKFLAETDPGARELFYDPGVNIDEGKRIGAIGGHTDHVHYVPSKVTEQASKDTVESLRKQDEDIEHSAKTQEDVLEELKQSNGALAEQIRIAQDPNASDAEVIRALQAIDDEIATTADREIHEGLEGVRDAVMDDRGIKKYDPFEGASTDPAADALKLAQAMVGLFNTIKSGLDNMLSVSGLLVRGISNTEDLNKLVDGFQGIASTVGEVVSTIGEVINIVASLAALAGAAIPGVGQVGAVVAGVTGGIGAVNGVIDLIQEVMSIAGMFVGMFLSTIAGGAGGPLMGDVRVLLDKNDNTIKTWSSDNPDDKRVHKLPGGSGTGGTTNNTGINTLQIYQGPGQSTEEVLRDTMFYVRASQTGAYAG